MNRQKGNQTRRDIADRIKALKAGQTVDASAASTA
jgi:hypothetical protein